MLLNTLLNKHHSERKGNLSVVENYDTVPFEVKRTYYLYDVPGGESRGGHAHKELSQLIIAASGSFTVTLDDGNVKRTFCLIDPIKDYTLYPVYGEPLMISLPELSVWFSPQKVTPRMIIYVITIIL